MRLLPYPSCVSSSSAHPGTGETTENGLKRVGNLFHKRKIDKEVVNTELLADIAS